MAADSRVGWTGAEPKVREKTELSPTCIPRTSGRTLSKIPRFLAASVSSTIKWG